MMRQKKKAAEGNHYDYVISILMMDNMASFVRTNMQGTRNMPMGFAYTLAEQ